MNYFPNIWNNFTPLRISKEMYIEPLLFADENTPEWAFSKRKGVIFYYNPFIWE